MQHAAFAGAFGAGRDFPDGGEGGGLLTPLQTHPVGIGEGHFPKLTVILHQILTRLFGFLAEVARDEAHAPDAPLPVLVHLVALDARDALARHHVEQHHGALVLDDLPLLRVPAVVADFHGLVATPPEADGILEPRQEVVRAVVHIILAEDEDVRLQLV